MFRWCFWSWLANILCSEGQHVPAQTCEDTSDKSNMVINNFLTTFSASQTMGWKENNDKQQIRRTGSYNMMFLYMSSILTPIWPAYCLHESATNSLEHIQISETVWPETISLNNLWNISLIMSWSHGQAQKQAECPFEQRTCDLGMKLGFVWVSANSVCRFRIICFFMFLLHLKSEWAETTMVKHWTKSLKRAQDHYAKFGLEWTGNEVTWTALSKSLQIQLMFFFVQWPEVIWKIAFVLKDILTSCGHENCVAIYIYIYVYISRYIYIYTLIGWYIYFDIISQCWCFLGSSFFSE